MLDVDEVVGRKEELLGGSLPRAEGADCEAKSVVCQVMAQDWEEVGSTGVVEFEAVFLEIGTA